MARKWCCRFVTIQYWARKSWTFDSWKFNSEWLSIELSPAHYWILAKMYFSVFGKKLSKNAFFSLIFKHLCISVFASYKKCFRLSHTLSPPKITQNLARIRAKFRVKVFTFLTISPWITFKERPEGLLALVLVLFYTFHLARWCWVVVVV